jgi:hypothetical protein
MLNLHRAEFFFQRPNLLASLAGTNRVGNIESFAKVGLKISNLSKNVNFFLLDTAYIVDYIGFFRLSGSCL